MENFSAQQLVNQMTEDDSSSEQNPSDRSWNESEEVLIQRALTEDAQAMGELWQMHFDQLHRITRYRMPARLRSRCSSEDILQEAFLDVQKGFSAWAASRNCSLKIYFRGKVVQKIIQLYRHHLLAERRDANREVDINGILDSTSRIANAIADGMTAAVTPPSRRVRRDECCRRLHEVLQTMSEMDRQIIELRHFEQLRNAECAQVLELSDTATHNRYVRAAERLAAALGPEEDWLT